MCIRTVGLGVRAASAYDLALSEVVDADLVVEGGETDHWSICCRDYCRLRVRVSIVLVCAAVILIVSWRWASVSWICAVAVNDASARSIHCSMLALGVSFSFC
jgi:hypothetical protein